MVNTNYNTFTAQWHFVRSHVRFQVCNGRKRPATYCTLWLSRIRQSTDFIMRDYKNDTQYKQGGYTRQCGETGTIVTFVTKTNA